MAFFSFVIALFCFFGVGEDMLQQQSVWINLLNMSWVLSGVYFAGNVFEWISDDGGERASAVAVLA